MCLTSRIIFFHPKTSRSNLLIYWYFTTWLVRWIVSEIFQLLIHLYTNGLLNHWWFYKLINSFIRSPIHQIIHQPFPSFNHSFNYLPTDWFNCISTHWLIHPIFHSFIHSFIYPSIHSCIHLFINLLLPLFYLLCIHPFIHLQSHFNS